MYVNICNNVTYIYIYIYVSNDFSGWDPRHLLSVIQGPWATREAGQAQAESEGQGESRGRCEIKSKNQTKG